MQTRASSQSPPPAQDPFGREQRDDEGERPRLVPQIAPLRLRMLGRSRPQPFDDPRRVGRTHVLTTGCPRDAPEESFVQPWAGELAIAAANVEPAVGVTERYGSLPRLDPHP